MVLTGGSGMIGSALLKAVLAEGWRVRVLTRNLASYKVHHPQVELVEGDLAEPQDWGPLVQGASVVVNAAAEITRADLMPAVNVNGPKGLLQAAIGAGVARWVQLSSVGAYGPVKEGQITEQWPDQPLGAYETTKTEFDLALIQACTKTDTQFCVVRPSNVYGPCMRNHSIRQLVAMIRRGLFVFIGPKGASANYVHVDDVVNALLLCITHPKAANQTYIVSAWDTLENMVGAIAEGLGVAPPAVRLNLRLVTWVALTLQKWPRWPLTLNRVRALSMRSRYATQKIEDELGWWVNVPVTKGMRQMAKASTL